MFLCCRYFEQLRGLSELNSKKPNYNVLHLERVYSTISSFSKLCDENTNVIGKYITETIKYIVTDMFI
jgi:hypothetical protein